MSDLQRTSLYDEHVAAGARIVPFAGWEMPVQYEGVKEEHLAVREKAGVFDVSHMGEIGAMGPQAELFLQRLVSNDVSKIAVGGAQYSCLCAEDGGVLDDLFTYRVADDEYLTVSNAANHDADLARFQEVARDFDVEITDRAPEFAMLAVQGPEARSIVSALADGAELPPRMKMAEGIDVAGVRCMVCGTGYTGESGVELLCAPDDAPALWRALLDVGVEPAGLGARDTLRLEVCFHLHGNEITPERNPIEAGLGWCCKEDTGFIGAEAIAAAREGTPQKLVALVLTERGIPRGGNPLVLGDEVVGELTSGTFAPSLNLGAGMGYVRADLAEPGTALEVDIRGRRRAAEIRPMPLYEKKKT
jgi:aminomethyltransferase